MNRRVWRSVVYHLEDARAVRALSRARDAGQAAMGMVIGLVLLITLSAGTLAATAIQHDPLVSNDVVQHLAYRALQSGIDSYLAALNENPNLVNCNSSNVSSSSTFCPSSQLPALNQWETVTGNTNNPVTEKFMWTNPWLCFNNACTAVGSTAGQTLSYVKELVYGFAESGNRISFQSSYVNLIPENGFLDNIFWSNYESTDPGLSSNSNASADCTYDWNNSYQGPDTTSPNNYNSSNCSAVYFGPNDVLDGPVYSNDSIYVSSNPDFGTSSNPSTVTTHDPNCLFVAPGDNHGSSSTCSGATADVGTYNSTTSSDNAPLEPIPTTDTALATIAAQNGCLYSGPTTITMSNSGSTEMMTVNSPDTPYTVGTSTTYNSSSGTDQNNSTGNTNTCTAGGSAIPIPANGVVFVQTATSAQQTATGCASSTLSNPPQNPFMGQDSSGTNSQDGYYDGETSIPNCEGDAFVHGGVEGALTIATQNDVIIDGNITYSTTDCGGSFNSTYTGQCGYQSSATSNDALGLIAFSFVEVDRPVTNSNGNVTVNTSCGGTGALPVPYCDPGGSGLTIDGALLALNDSFAVNNYNRSGTDGTLQVYGAIAQDYRGAVGTFSGNTISTGYSKNYVWDSRLGYVNVPNYLNPGTPRWGIASTAVNQGVACTTSTQLPGPWLATSNYSSPNLANSPGNCDSVTGHP